ncbi:hypothetical protein GH714_019817 [Hevea brasiliensis]|uniref:Uncharacterized protein n=1 Tax=Hevea brasiliensis TaxID=3981 RepID=A0A6A6LAC3_HEVBR|nr:hypothetical protein GH714_019817 [Hevea brasiliensis]
MTCCAAFGNRITIYNPLPEIKLFRIRSTSSVRLNKYYGGYSFAKQIFCSNVFPPQNNYLEQKKLGVHYDSLRILEWDKLCDLVSSFAGTSLGREASKMLYEDIQRDVKVLRSACKIHLRMNVPSLLYVSLCLGLKLGPTGLCILVPLAAFGMQDGRRQDKSFLSCM